MSLLKDLKFAEGIVQEAWESNKGLFSSPEVVSHKPQGDLVTEADLAINEYIKQKISDNYPDYDFYSEEEEYSPSDSEYIWILDPIDGTKYFAKKVPFYAISLALQYKGGVILGVVYSPELNQMFTASKGNGAFQNGLPIKCSDQTDLAKSMICVEIPSKYSRKADMDKALDQLRTIIDNVERARIIGVSSIGLCWAAMGGFDGYINLGSSSQIWDIAGGRAILEEAGGRFDNINGTIVAGPPGLQKKLVELLKPSHTDK